MAAISRAVTGVFGFTRRLSIGEDGSSQMAWPGLRGVPRAIDGSCVLDPSTPTDRPARRRDGRPQATSPICGTLRGKTGVRTRRTRTCPIGGSLCARRRRRAIVACGSPSIRRSRPPSSSTARASAPVIDCRPIKPVDPETVPPPPASAARRHRRGSLARRAGARRRGARRAEAVEDRSVHQAAVRDMPTLGKLDEPLHAAGIEHRRDRRGRRRGRRPAIRPGRC